MVSSKSRSRAFVCLSLLLAGSLAAVAGCKNGAETDASPSGAGKSAVTSASGDAGKAVFAAQCTNCHSIGGMGGRRGPDLSHVGAESEHTAQWIAEFVKDPKSKKPGSRMPAFGNRIPDSDLKALSEYLAGLK